MEKLIELFKQHKRETGTSYEYILFRDDDAGLQARCIDDGKEIYIVRQAEILSKKIGFIKRLVENDKIDRSKFKKYSTGDTQGEREIQKIYYYGRISTNELNYTEGYSEADELLMLLSIQDSPIDFLCEILK